MFPLIESLFPILLKIFFTDKDMYYCFTTGKNSFLQPKLCASTTEEYVFIAGSNSSYLQVNQFVSTNQNCICTTKKKAFADMNMCFH